MTRSPYPVSVHNGNKAASVTSDYSKSSLGSYSSSSSTSTPRSLSPGEYELRDPYAVGHTVNLSVSARDVSVWNHHKTNFNPDEPSPGYRRP